MNPQSTVASGRWRGSLLTIGLIACAGQLHAQSIAPFKAIVSNDQTFCDGYEQVSDCGLPPKPPTVLLEQISPIPSDSANSIQFRAGWPLIFRASVADADMLGLGRVYGQQGFEPQLWQFPEVGQGAAFVFEDPDGVWSFSIPSAVMNDERILDFYPDLGDSNKFLGDVSGAPFTRDPVSRFNLRPEFGGPLPQQTPEGNLVQTVIEDGVQFGADDDFPGLVILSDVEGLRRRAVDPSSLVPRIGRGELVEAGRWAEGRMKKKVLGVEEALAGGVEVAIIATSRGERPLSAALAGGGSHFGDQAAHEAQR